jgi:hypothetical protein
VGNTRADGALALSSPDNGYSDIGTYDWDGGVEQAHQTLPRSNPIALECNS